MSIIGFAVVFTISIRVFFLAASMLLRWTARSTTSAILVGSLASFRWPASIVATSRSSFTSWSMDWLAPWIVWTISLCSSVRTPTAFSFISSASPRIDERGFRRSWAHIPRNLSLAAFALLSCSTSSWLLRCVRILARTSFGRNGLVR